ncbi:CKS-domain-containing protein [Gonapodya prolifera JEL478]|uniref:Cyclin-dependent kinases regulatory subunit n=1 Tax=Gonapodya prolifera (strain JEL478) TaxID=1344416 RepID=A0A139ADT0_GONPJ|nr:CKS-domain-containing protein [Gonapodya prolifera JEL478]|eukprot:KXS14573.1 CKS-domain-containing protein [Gonapodya prolifera JEL478]
MADPVRDDTDNRNFDVVRSRDGKKRRMETSLGSDRGAGSVPSRRTTETCEDSFNPFNPPPKEQTLSRHDTGKIEKALPLQPLPFIYEPPVELPDPFEEYDSNTQMTISKLKESIFYADKYADDVHEYRHVILPKRLCQYIPDRFRNRLLNESEWRALGIQQSPGWEHYLLHGPEPHIYLFRREKDFQLKYVPVLAVEVEDNVVEGEPEWEEWDRLAEAQKSLELHEGLDCSVEAPLNPRTNSDEKIDFFGVESHNHHSDSTHDPSTFPIHSHGYESRFLEHRDPEGYDDDTADERSVAATEDTDVGGLTYGIPKKLRPSRRAAQVAAEQITVPNWTEWRAKANPLDEFLKHSVPPKQFESYINT